jgi:hypothetical protein
MDNKFTRLMSVVFSSFMYMLLPPLIIGGGISMIWGAKYFLPSFLCFLGIDLIVGFVVNQIISLKRMSIMADLQKEQMEYERGHVVGVSCANCGERNLVPLDLSVDAFECTNCKHVNKLYYEFRAQQVSDIERSNMMKEIANRMAESSSASDAIWDSVR